MTSLRQMLREQGYEPNVVEMIVRDVKEPAQARPLAITPKSTPATHVRAQSPWVEVMADLNKRRGAELRVDIAADMRAKVAEEDRARSAQRGVASPPARKPADASGTASPWPPIMAELNKRREAELRVDIAADMRRRHGLA